MKEADNIKTHSRYNVARIALITWCLFIGIGALFGSMCMIFDPTGEATRMAGLLPGLRKLPFADTLFRTLTFSGIALLCVNGIPNLTAAVLMFMKKKAGVVCGTVFGLTLMAWITIQFFIFPSNYLSNSYFIFGVLQALTGCAAWIFYDQEHFCVHAEDYKNIGTNPARLVVYFSRMGYTKIAALEEADRTSAAVYEIKTTEHTEGTLGYWWCGRFGMHRWDMPIENITVDLCAYEHLTICSPVWVFHIAGPIRTFCKEASGKIKEADYILTHFQRCLYNNAVAEMNELLGIIAVRSESICCRQGKVISRKLNGEQKNIHEDSAV